MRYFIKSLFGQAAKSRKRTAAFVRLGVEVLETRLTPVIGSGGLATIAAAGTASCS
jgi:hypothetical protein